MKDGTVQGKGLVNGGLGSRFEERLAETVKTELAKLPEREHVQLPEVELRPMLGVSDLEVVVPKFVEREVVVDSAPEGLVFPPSQFPGAADVVVPGSVVSASAPSVSPVEAPFDEFEVPGWEGEGGSVTPASPSAPVSPFVEDSVVLEFDIDGGSPFVEEDADVSDDQFTVDDVFADGSEVTVDSAAEDSFAEEAESAPEGDWVGLVDESAVIDEADVEYEAPSVIENAADVDADSFDDEGMYDDLMLEGHFEPLGTSSIPVVDESPEADPEFVGVDLEGVEVAADAVDGPFEAEDDEALDGYLGGEVEEDEDALDADLFQQPAPVEPVPAAPAERVIEREVIREFHYVNGAQAPVESVPADSDASGSVSSPFHNRVHSDEVPSHVVGDPDASDPLDRIDAEAEEEREVLAQQEEEAEARRLAQEKSEADFRAAKAEKAITPKKEKPAKPAKPAKPVKAKSEKPNFFVGMFTKPDTPEQAAAKARKAAAKNRRPAEAPLFEPDEAALARAAKLNGGSTAAAADGDVQPLRVQTAGYAEKVVAPVVEEKKTNSLFARKRSTPLEDAAGVNPQEWLESTILRALALNASDLHISVDGLTHENLIARIRVDGVMMDFDEVHGVSAKIIMGRLKAATNLTSAGSFEPEETIYEIELDGEVRKARAVLFRTHDAGEALVMRLPLGGELKELTELDFAENNLQHFYNLLESPSKMIMIAGPMGSGKTTTAHGAMLHVATDERTVWTIEDPVERTLPGAVQLEIDEENGAGFDVLLSKLLRADYNTLFLGEIRDHATAAAGVRQAKAGRQVMSTIHANNNVTALLRLIELAQDSPLSVLDSVRGVVSQRLVRRLNKDWDGVDPKKKYSGRVPIHEVLFVDDNLIEVMMQNKPLTEIKNAALQAQGSTFADDCNRLLAAGITDEEEIRRVIGDNY